MMSLNAVWRGEMGPNWVGRRQIWPEVTSFLEKTAFVVNNAVWRGEIGPNWVGRRQIWPEVTSFLEKTAFVVNI